MSQPALNTDFLDPRVLYPLAYTRTAAWKEDPYQDRLRIDLTHDKSAGFDEDKRQEQDEDGEEDRHVANNEAREWPMLQDSNTEGNERDLKTKEDETKGNSGDNESDNLASLAALLTEAPNRILTNDDEPGMSACDSFVEVGSSMTDDESFASGCDSFVEVDSPLPIIENDMTVPATDINFNHGGGAIAASKQCEATVGEARKRGRGRPKKGEAPARKQAKPPPAFITRAAKRKRAEDEQEFRPPTPTKRGRGRPRKGEALAIQKVEYPPEIITRAAERGRAEEEQEPRLPTPTKRGRGRPRKHTSDE